MQHTTTYVIKSIITTAILLLALCTLHGQDSLNFESTFGGDRRLFLKDANKLSTWPQTKDSVVQMTTIKYTTLPTPKSITIEPALIPAAKINVEEKLPYLYKAYIKAGYGTYNTAPVDFYFTDGRSKKGTYGVHYQFLRGDGVPLDDKDSIPDRYSDHKAEAWAKWFFKKQQLLARAGWERNVNHFYGVDVKNDYTGPAFDSLQFDQRMNTFGGGLSLFTHQRDTGDFNYNADVYLRSSRDFYKNEETNFDILIHGRSLVDSTLYAMDVGVNYNNFRFFGPQMDGLNLNLQDPIPYSADNRQFRARERENAIIKFVPTASTTWRNLRAKVGMGVYIEGNSSQPGHFYPLLEASYSLFNGIVVPYAGIRGSTTPTTYLGLYQQNPFIQTFPRLRNRNNKLDVYAGIGGAVSSVVSYSAGVNYYEWANFEYFINDSVHDAASGYAAWGNQMAVLYDDLEAINLHGELAIYASEKWKGNIRADYFNYTNLGLQDHPWHQPKLKLLANAQYNLKNKFIIGTDLFYTGARWAKSTVPVNGVEAGFDSYGKPYYQYKLKGYLDMNLRVEYRYNKRLSAWVQLHNALAMKYQRWGAYTNQQLVAMLGASYSF
ncbi:MAG: hypothetical protein ACKVOR_07930 [Flavobacteriales bacterium]